MAVPKKRTSKSKTRARQAYWKRKAYHQALKSISLAKSILSMKSNSFLYLSQDLSSENE